MPNPNLPINFRKNTYIGARYVPKFSDTPGSEWDNSIQYEPLTIVLYQGNSYTSKTFVPVGVDINNDTYWAETGNYNAQVEQYRTDVINYTKIVNNYVETLNNKPFINVKQYGAKGDGVSDDTMSIQSALDIGLPVFFPPGTYIVDEDLTYNGGYLLGCGESSIIKRKGNSLTNYAVLLIMGSSVIDNLHIIGDRKEHTGTSGEWGMCIEIRASNVEVRNCILKDGWGDGIYVGEGQRDNVKIINSLIDNQRRNGISIVACTNFVVDSCTIKNTNGTRPMKGIDIEPNNGNEIVSGTIQNCKFINNYRGSIHLSFQNLQTDFQIGLYNNYTYGTGVNQGYDTSDDLNISIVKSGNYKGSVYVNGFYSEGCNVNGVSLTVRQPNIDFVLKNININNFSGRYAMAFSGNQPLNTDVYAIFSNQNKPDGVASYVFYNELDNWVAHVKKYNWQSYWVYTNSSTKPIFRVDENTTTKVIVLVQEPPSTT